MPKRTVVIETRERNPWGESVDESLVNDPSKTTTFIAGYSDVRANREREELEGGDPRPLKHRLQWVRCERPNGEADGRRVAHWKRKGYTIPTWQELQASGYAVELSAAQKGADESARLGDLKLMWADARTAATHYQAQREATAEASQNYVNAMEQAVEKANIEMKYPKGSRGATGAIFELEGDDIRKLKK